MQHQIQNACGIPKWATDLTDDINLLITQKYTAHSIKAFVPQLSRLELSPPIHPYSSVKAFLSIIAPIKTNTKKVQLLHLFSTMKPAHVTAI